MVEVKRAWRNSQGGLTEGSKVATLKYDALNRRIVKDIDDSGDWDCAYHYYYTGPRMVELRNGSGNVLKQYVWGRQYVDELVQIGINDDPADAGEDDCETFYWVMQDAHFNVLGLADSGGNLKERYEYTPYGQRTVYKSAGTNDPMCMSPILESQRVTVSSVDQPYSLCDTGHQGLLHDKEFTLIYNRARYLIPHLGRFNRRDPIGYWDGMSLYEYCGSEPVGSIDPSGLGSVSSPAGAAAAAIEMYSISHPSASPAEIAAATGLTLAYVAKYLGQTKSPPNIRPRFRRMPRIIPAKPIPRATPGTPAGPGLPLPPSPPPPGGGGWREIVAALLELVNSLRGGGMSGFVIVGGMDTQIDESPPQIDESPPTSPTSEDLEDEASLFDEMDTFVNAHTVKPKPLPLP